MTTPYIISGTTKDSYGSNKANVTVEFNCNGLLGKAVSDSNGNYVYDLAALDYTVGDTVSYIAEEEYENEIYSGSFVVSGSNKTLNISLSCRTSPKSVAGNRDSQICNIGGRHVSIENPLPVRIDAVPFGNINVTDTSNALKRSTSTITVAGGSGSVTVNDVDIRSNFMGVKAPNSTATFTVTITDSSGVIISSFQARSSDGGNASSKSLGIPVNDITIAISSASVDGTYTYLIMG